MATATAAGRGRSGPGPDTTSTSPTKADQRALRARAAKADAERSDAYQRGHADGKAGHPHGHSAPLEPYLDDVYDQGYRDGTDEKPAARTDPPAGTPAAADNGADDGPTSGGSPAPASGAPAGGGSSSGGFSLPSIEITDQGASFLLGLIGYALVVSYLDYGWAGVTGWFRAKFTNNASGGLRPAGGQAVLIPTANPGTGAPSAQTGGLLA